MYNEQFARAVLTERARERDARAHGHDVGTRDSRRRARPALRVRRSRLEKLFGGRRPRPASPEVTTRPA
jgi:hypothetical protein